MQTILNKCNMVVCASSTTASHVIFKYQANHDIHRFNFICLPFGTNAAVAGSDNFFNFMNAVGHVVISNSITSSAGVLQFYSISPAFRIDPSTYTHTRNLDSVIFIRIDQALPLSSDYKTALLATTLLSTLTSNSALFHTLSLNNQPLHQRRADDPFNILLTHLKTDYAELLQPLLLKLSENLTGLDPHLNFLIAQINGALKET